MACNEHKHPLQHGGTGRAQRSVKALAPGYAGVDERTEADWIVFAHEFAGFLNYFDENNDVAGNWKVFFGSDISAVLGTIVIQDIDSYKQRIKEEFDFLRDDDNNADILALKKRLNQLFSILFTLCLALDSQYTKLPDNLLLKNILLNLIKSKLAPALKRLMGYYKAAHLTGLSIADLGGLKVLGMPVINAAAFMTDDTGRMDLEAIWIHDDSSMAWKTYRDSIAGDDSIFINQPGDDEYHQVRYAAHHNLFTGIFDQYLFALSRFVSAAHTEFEQTLHNWDSHQPHYALFLAFLKLFRYARQHINTITGRHLDFYYKKVLGLKPAPEQPNQVHVLIELAKQIESYLLTKATALKAGKDSKGKEVTYTLDRATTFNKAKIHSLKSLYIAAADESLPEQLNDKRIFASPVTNSADGLGEALSGAYKEWHPFVNKSYGNGSFEGIKMPVAQIGFAVASHYLYLNEGQRKVMVSIASAAYLQLHNKKVVCFLTTEKGWFQVPGDVVFTATDSTRFSDNTTPCARLSFTLAGDVPPIVNYNASIHGGTYNVAVPLLKIYLVQDFSTDYQYESLKNITVTKIEVRVEVGAMESYQQLGLKNLLLSNDYGPVDASKPFLPFGPQPKKDAGFVLGHKEIFSKKNLALRLDIEWAELPDDSSKIKYITDSSSTNVPVPPKAVTHILKDGAWQSSNMPASVNLFDGIQPKVKIFDTSGEVFSLSDSGLAYPDNYVPLNAATTEGFIRLSLKGSFGHSEYIRDLAKYYIEKTPDISDTITVERYEPYTPKIKSLYADYTAWQTVDIASVNALNFEQKEILFFHMYPFGEAEQHQYLNQQYNAGSSVYLLPRFGHYDEINAVTVSHQGEFYIGIESLEANQSVNILFQVLEGSAHPLILKPADHIHWSYLSHNNWVAFKPQEVSDGTLGLLQSGIISFAIPEKASADNTLMPSGFIWVRAAVAGASEAVCAILSVQAQAALVSFQPGNNAADFLENPLLPGTISKLKMPDAAVKKADQPYPSFGGRPQEDESHFYMRASERLRHKNRAITIWDYEHLVLEAFPEIYRVQCLSHTSVKESGGKNVYNESAPGHVLLVTIPVLTGRNDTNPLKPYTNRDLLTRIENYIKERVSCFVTVKTSQPQFEEIRLSFSLKLYDSYQDFTYFSNLLKEAVTGFLTPWTTNADTDIAFGGTITKSALINFVEEQYYVDYITDVKMFVAIPDPGLGMVTESEDREEITASTARSILVSAPPDKHIINKITIVTAAADDKCVDVNLL
ncbi:hypothetical protein [Niabella aquatica]